jgi:hypothetical protein
VIGCSSGWLKSSRRNCPYTSLVPGSSVRVTGGCKFPMGKVTGRSASEPMSSLVENSFPKANARKETLRKWLDDKGIPWGEDLLKFELYTLCKFFEPKPEYKIDKIAEAAGHQILRTPQYHPEFKPIEMCWGVMKNFMAKHCDFTLQKLRKNLPLAFAQITSKTCQSLIAKTVAEENR